MLKDHSNKIPPPRQSEAGTQPEQPVRWPNNLSDAEFVALINCLDLNLNPLVACLHDLVLHAEPEEGPA